MPDVRTEARVVDAIWHTFRIDRDKIIPAATIQSLGLDSLETVELTIELEEEFDIEIGDDEALALCATGTVADIARMIETKLAAASA